VEGLRRYMKTNPCPFRIAYLRTNIRALDLYDRKQECRILGEFR
jgi:hypothetical protein